MPSSHRQSLAFLRDNSSWNFHNSQISLLSVEERSQERASLKKKKKIGKGERKITGKDDSIKGYMEATTVKTENWSQMICTIDSQTRPFVYTRNTQTRRAFPK